MIAVKNFLAKHSLNKQHLGNWSFAIAVAIIASWVITFIAWVLFGFLYALARNFFDTDGKNLFAIVGIIILIPTILAWFAGIALNAAGLITGIAGLFQQKSTRSIIGLTLNIGFLFIFFSLFSRYNF